MAEQATTVSAPKPSATRLRELLSREKHITLCPGVYDGLTARIALNEGFDCLYMVRCILMDVLHSFLSHLVDWRWHSCFEARHA